jgi:tetratricopeptide (TPR) repeat protein
LAALLFALHPVGVESVARIAEQKNTLSAIFYLGAALAYLRFDEDRKASRYAVAAVLFVLALLTKSVTATLPAALLVVFWWQRGRLSWRSDVVPLLPWFGVGMAAGLFTAWFEHALIGAQGEDFALSGIDRGLVAGRVIWFYLGKLFWPDDLLFIYPRWIIDRAVLWQYAFPLAGVGLLAALFWWRRRNRGPCAAFLFFAGTLFPVLGFFNVYPFLYSFVTDHFQYLASLGIFALIAAGMMTLRSRLPRAAGVILTAGVLATLGALTRSQCVMYRDEYSLYQATLAKNPACWMAHNNLALILSQRGQLDLARQHLECALELRPRFAEAENNIGDVLNRLGRPEEAVPHFERALRLQPGYREAHYNLGVAMVALNRPADAIAQFKAALLTSPDYAFAHRALGRVLATTGRGSEALPHFERAVELDPAEPEGQIDLGFALMLMGRVADALPHLERAVELRPDFAQGHNVLGRALVAARRLDEAILHFEAAVELAPDFAEARQNLAQARRDAGHLP